MNLIQTKSFRVATYLKGNTNSKKLALALPGKLDTKDYAHMKSHVNYLADKGFLALSFDPPGTWESPGDISLYNTTNYIKAVNELIEYFGNKPTFIMGHSKGGSIAMIAGAQNPVVTAFAGIMLSFSERGFNNEKDKGWKEKESRVSMRDFPPGGGPKMKRFNLPYSFFEDQLLYERNDKLMKSTKPKLIVLGKYDDLISAESLRKFYDLLMQPKELYEIKSDHDYRLKEKLIKEINNVVGNFLKKFYKE